MVKYTIKAKLKTSLVHTEDVDSNISSIFRDKVIIENKIHYIPALHGNSIRGVLRDLSAQFLCDSIGIENNTLPINVFHILFSGGALERSESYIDITKKIEMRQMLPMLSIFGSAMGNEMMQGKLMITTAYPQCIELGNSTVSYNDMTNIIRYTRIDDQKRITGETYAIPQENKAQMFYDIETLNAGNILEFSIYLDSTNPVEISALNTALNILKNKKPFLGGCTRAGHGNIEFEFNEETETYTRFLQENKNEIKQYLLSNFERKQTTPKKDKQEQGDSDASDTTQEVQE
jgi:hypothetical protein